MSLSKLKAVALLLVVVSGVTVGGFLRHTQAADPPGDRQATADAPLVAQAADPIGGRKPKGSDPDKVMTAGEVLSVFDKNEAAGEDRFLGKTVRVSGKARKVERVSWSGTAPPPVAESDQNYYLLTLLADRADGVGPKKDPGGHTGKALPAAFLFPAGNRKELGGLEEGQRVTVEGVCQGRAEGTLVFAGCKLVKGE